MGTLHYYEFLLMQKFQEGVVLIEEPLKSGSEVNGDSRCNIEQSENEKQIRTSSSILLIILVKNKEEKKVNEKLQLCHLQLACHSYRHNRDVFSKYNNFLNDETIIVYNKHDFKVEFKRVSSELWFLHTALEQHPQRLLLFLDSEVKCKNILGEMMLTHYINQNRIVEMHLDNIFRRRELALPPEVFRCTNVKVLSLKNNFITSLSADIGRMCNLEQLILTNNLLTVGAIPQTLMFCSKLAHLYLDDNHLDALPGFLLNMSQLKSVRRHGNHNYFKATFIWYHKELNERVLKIKNDDEKKIMQTVFQPLSLELLAIQSVISSRENFFCPGFLPESLQDFISHVFKQFNICGHCSITKPSAYLGYKVFTFKTPYLGNTSVPFQHWACSRECGEGIEIPARHAQLKSYRKMDDLYDRYIAAIQSDYNNHKNVPPDKSKCIII